jgi:hypothetical protein
VALVVPRWLGCRVILGPPVGLMRGCSIAWGAFTRGGSPGCWIIRRRWWRRWRLWLADVAGGSVLETELLPEVHQGEFTFEVNLPVGTPIEETGAILSRVEQAILANKDDIHTLIVTFGYDVTNMKRSDEGEHSARFKILIEPSRQPAGPRNGCWEVCAGISRIFPTSNCGSCGRSCSARRRRSWSRSRGIT